MGIKQLSIFLENNLGKLADATSVLAKAQVNIKALSIADTADFGILRVITDDVEKAKAALSGAQWTYRESEVLAVEVGNFPGSLAGVMEVFQGANVNIEYVYSVLEWKPGKAVLLFKLGDAQKGIAALKERGVTVLDSI
ncbi:MAG: amino acid-binding protein [Spirochaetaceae bacterium]|jgi:hypothetical protein|nr:amino acid-binding protein [Spirochaetaceae bacterium]